MRETVLCSGKGIGGKINIGLNLAVSFGMCYLGLFNISEPKTIPSLKNTVYHMPNTDKILGIKL